MGLTNVIRFDPFGELGHCFRNCFYWMEANGADLDKGMLMVHGTAFFPKPNRRGAHAWVEVDDLVIDPTAGIMIRKEDYYRVGQIKVRAKFTMTQCRENAVRTRHWGPWDQNIPNKKERTVNHGKDRVSVLPSQR